MKTALYYPLVDPSNKSLLINSLLYWDEIATIVPQSMDAPYKNELTEELERLCVLKAERVNPDLNVVDDVGNDILSLSADGRLSEFLIENGNANDILYLEKISPNLANVLENARMWPEKLPGYIRHALSDNRNEDGTINVNRNFAKLYMSLLAKKICLQNGYTAITDRSNYFNLSPDQNFERGRFPRNHRRWHDEFERSTLASPEMHQSMAITAALEMFELRDDIDPTKILNFKEKYSSELLRFRKAIESIKPESHLELTPKALLNHIQEKVKTEVIPATSSLKKACESSSFMLIPNTISVMTALTIPAAGFFTLSNLSRIDALGISMIAYLSTSLIKVRRERADLLEKNPYSYLFHMEQELT